MAILNEGIDATHSAGMGSYRVLVGDTFNGTLGGTDAVDGVNLEGLTIGETYTVSFTVDDLAGFTSLYLMDQFIYVAANFNINNGVISGGAQDFGSAITSELRIDGNTVSFEFTAVTRASFSQRMEGDGSSEAYELTLTEYVAPPAITEGADAYIGTTGDDNVSLLGGDDTFDGGAGNDTVNGDAGNDTLTGGADNDVFVIGAASGADVITDFTLGEDKIDIQALGINAIEDLTVTDVEGNAAIDLGNGNQITLKGRAAAELDNDDFILVDNVFNGDVVNDKTNGKSGVDFMYGNDGDDQLDGKAGDDHLEGGLGRDKLTDGEGDDVALGGDGNDLLEGDVGNDVLDGGRNNDRIYGGTGDDTLTGDHGNDLLNGGDGNDILNGGIGKDLMTGGVGADTFIFEIDSHRATITDFEDGADLLDFSGFVGVNSAADLFIAQNGTDTVITAGGPASVTLLDTDATLISDADFVF
ncbi:calcium-binding protein [Sulfitobacter sp.]|uniref:calcium-binding protein n=1 Tax=Sulfitobacter sp. TaxID=1903071 RepID=UPI003001E42C